MKVYGDTKTSLELSPKAYEIYINSDPCVICEHETESGDLTYSMSGIIERDGMTAEEVNELLEQLGED